MEVHLHVFVSCLETAQRRMGKFFVLCVQLGNGQYAFVNELSTSSYKHLSLDFFQFSRDPVLQFYEIVVLRNNFFFRDLLGDLN